MQGGVIQGNIITAVFLARSSERGPAGKEMLVNMHMVFLNVGFTLPSTVPVFARMRRDAQEGSVSLLTSQKSFAPCMLRQVLLCLLRDHSQPLLLLWTWGQLPRFPSTLHP
ncbi:hypothetical protein ACFX12_006087 [Malus domestica]